MQLVINTFGASLKRTGDRFVIRAGPNRLKVAAAKVQSILITTAVYLSSDAVALAVTNNIDIVFLDKFGDRIARVWPPRMGSTAAIRRRQLEAATAPEGLAVAREWVAAKLRHRCEFLEELCRRRPNQAGIFGGPIATIRASLAQIDELDGLLDEQRGACSGWKGRPAAPISPAWASSFPKATVSRAAAASRPATASTPRSIMVMACFVRWSIAPASALGLILIWVSCTQTTTTNRHWSLI